MLKPLRERNPSLIPAATIILSILRTINSAFKLEFIVVIWIGINLE
jgi:hypothetical protein